MTAGQEPEDVALETALNQCYARAVAMHESIQEGRGAVGWDDRACRAILTRLVRAGQRRELEAVEKAADEAPQPDKPPCCESCWEDGVVAATKAISARLALLREE